MDVAKIDADIAHIQQVSKRVKLFADKVLAHSVRTSLDQASLPNFDELGACVDEFSGVATRYMALLTGSAYGRNLLPTEQYDWFELWSFPWRPRH